MTRAAWIYSAAIVLALSTIAIFAPFLLGALNAGG
jgi:hypothetical protein